MTEQRFSVTCLMFFISFDTFYTCTSFNRSLTFIILVCFYCWIQLQDYFLHMQFRVFFYRSSFLTYLKHCIIGDNKSTCKISVGIYIAYNHCTSTLSIWVYFSYIGGHKPILPVLNTTKKNRYLIWFLQKLRYWQFEFFRKCSYWVLQI